MAYTRARLLNQLVLVSSAGILKTRRPRGVGFNQSSDTTDNGSLKFLNDQIFHQPLHDTYIAFPPTNARREIKGRTLELPRLLKNATHKHHLSHYLLPLWNSNLLFPIHARQSNHNHHSSPRLEMDVGSALARDPYRVSPHHARQSSRHDCGDNRDLYPF